MGLDMYLAASKYVSGWDHNKNESKALFAKVLEAVNLDDEDVTPHAPSGTVKLNVMYWRKANAIHGWFVQNVQGGKDDCESYYVTREQLQELTKECKKVLNNREEAAGSMPTQSGFFFGPTEYDDGYFEDLRETVERIDKLLLDPKFAGWDFSYQSSW